MQNCLVLTSKSTTAAMTTSSETCLQCKPRNFLGHIASQKEDMLRVKENKEQNPKKLGAIRHAVRQTCEVMNASSDAAEFKISLMFRRVARPARQWSRKVRKSRLQKKHSHDPTVSKPIQNIIPTTLQRSEHQSTRSSGSLGLKTTP